MEFTDPETRGKARRMRRQYTRAERRLWTWLRNRRFGNYKFRRQHPIGPYVVDYYCRELKLVIEVDGVQHATIEVADQDTKRTVMIEGYGIRILRLTNEIMMTQPDIACDCIKWAIERTLAGDYPTFREKVERE